MELDYYSHLFPEEKKSHTDLLVISCWLCMVECYGIVLVFKVGSSNGSRTNDMSLSIFATSFSRE